MSIKPYGIFVVITKKVENPIEIEEARAIIKDFLKSDNWRIIDRDVETFLVAIDLIQKHNIHLWDALIAASMKENDLIEIVTENKKDFDKIPSIKVSVPFLSST